LSTRALVSMHSKYSAKIYGRYGFIDAFNPQTGWTDTDVIGINVGIILLSAENMRTASIWRWFMHNPEIPAALKRVGLRKYRNLHVKLVQSCCKLPFAIGSNVDVTELR